MSNPNITILNQQLDTIGVHEQWTVVYWIPVMAADAQVPKPGFVSAVPLQSGAQSPTHCPATHIWFDEHGPHDPPHPSSPHALPAQSAAHGAPLPHPPQLSLHCAMHRSSHLPYLQQ